MSDAAERVRALVTEGLRAEGHRYDQERYEELAHTLDALTADGSAGISARSMAEALSKTGVALTRSEVDRERFTKLVDLVRELNDGRSYFGPASNPRETIDDRLDSISSRYVTPKTGVNVIVDDGSGRLLMVQRADRGQWSIPGGYADVGLSGSEVAVKEAFEETGFNVEIVALLGEFDNLRHAGQPIPQYTLMFHGLVTGGEARHHPDEATDLRWFNQDELPERIWQNGEPWLEVALRAVEGVPQAPYFDKPR